MKGDRVHGCFYGMNSAGAWFAARPSCCFVNISWAGSEWSSTCRANCLPRSSFFRAFLLNGFGLRCHVHLLSSRQQKTAFIPLWDEHCCVRGATRFRLRLQIFLLRNKNLPDEASGRIASLTHQIQAGSRYPSSVTGAAVLDTGASARSPQSSEVHSAPSSRAGLSPTACSLNRRSALTRPRQSLFDIARYYMPATFPVKAERLP